MNSFHNFIRSDKFNQFLSDQIEFRVIDYADSINKDDNQKMLKMQESVKKIIIHWKPVIETIRQEIK
jgi:hypothetical protein